MMDLLLSKTDEGAASSYNVLADAVKCSTDITILSAFYDNDFLFTLMKNVPKRVRSNYRIRIILNGSYGRRGVTQSEDLIFLSKTLKKMKFGNVDIRLIYNGGGMFHAKLYLVMNHTQPRWFVGSPNATKNGFSINDEVLLHFRGRHDDLRAYVRNKHDESIPVTEIKPSGVGIADFFRSGSLYFKSMAQVSFSYNLSLQDHVVDQLKNRNSLVIRYTEAELPFSSFNILRTLPNYSDENLKARTNNVTIKKFSIETCLGYWVPSSVSSVVDNLIAAKSHYYEHFLKSISDSLSSEFQRRKSEQNFLECLEDIEAASEEAIDKDSMAKNFLNFYDGLERRLKIPQLRTKYAQPYVVTPVPEIWDDKLASSDFKLSFFLDLWSRILESGMKKWSVAAGIIDSLGVAPSDITGHQQLEAMLIAFLDKNEIDIFGWENEELDNGGDE